MEYVTSGPLTAYEVLERAAEILAERYQRGQTFTSPKLSEKFFLDKLSHREQEVFCVLFLDSQHRLIEFKEMFTGTIDGAAVYPREVVKEALRLNAAAVVFGHNHPSGSQADRKITDRLIEALKLVDIRVLDHLVIGNQSTISFASRGYL